MNWRREADRIAADARGRHAESQACAWLREQGYAILAQRVKTPRGEVDIIASAPGLTLFVEVKWRAHAADLAHAIDQRRLSRVAHAAQLLAPTYAKAGDDIRIDILLLAPDAPMRHIANAWMPL
jgi:putative endonuclease